ncbi:MAG: site-2 protease family protein [Chloroflexi bacterium]|nr:MAG: site-2 protease family protein [Chloroflexota bacterium]
MSGPGAYVAVVLYVLPGLVIGSVLHELAHAAVAMRCGDPTPRRSRLLTLDPRRHLDPFGTSALLIAGIGWSKPVSPDPLHVRRNTQRAAIAVAGPLANLAVAAAFAIALRVEVLASGINVDGFLILAQFTAQGILVGLLLEGFLVNVALFVFNALPLPGLDGYAVLRSALFTRAPRAFLWMENQRFVLYAAVIIVVVLLPQTTHGVINPLSSVTVGLAGQLYSHAVEPGVTPLFLPLPNVFTLFG